MALVLKDRVRETTTTTGTGTITLAGAVTGFQTFTSVLSNSDETYYCITDGANFEVGKGTFTSSGTTLSRDTVLESSNSGNKVDWGAGTRDVFITQPAEKAVYLDSSGNIDTANGSNLTNLNASNLGSGTVPNARLDAQLQDVAGLAVTDGGFIVGDGSNFVLETGATARTSIGVGSIATQAADSVNIDGGAIDGVTIGTNTAVTELQVDSININNSTISSSGGIVLDATGNNTDIVFKGTDGGVDTTFLTIDGSNAGLALFNGGVGTAAYFWQQTDGNTALFAGANFEIALVHVHNTGFKLTNAGTGTPAVELQFVDANEAVGSDGTNLLLTSGGTEYSIPTSDGSAGQFLKTDGSGALSFATVSTDLVADTSPQLGGNLDVNGNEITSASNGNVVVNPNGTGTIELEANTNVTGTMYASGNIGLDSTDFISFTGNTRMDITINNSNEFRFESDGDFHADGDVVAFSTTVSDERLKSDIAKIDGAVDKLEQLNGYTFTYTADGKQSAGVIAQEVEKILPSAVSEKELPLKTDDGIAYKTVQYDQLHALLIEAVKELSARVKELEDASRN